MRKKELWLDNMDLTHEQCLFLLELLKGTGANKWNEDEINEEIRIVEDRIFEEIILGGEDEESCNILSQP